MRRLALLLLFTVSAHAQITYIKAARMFDGRSEQLITNPVIVVEGKAIKAAASGIAIPGAAHVIDLGDRTLMPGMIDAHRHIALHSGSYDEQVMRESPEFRAIVSTVDAKTTLEAGITTIRDVGNEGAGLTDLALRDAIAAGWVPGPRILAAIHPVVTTGAYRIGRLSPDVRPPAISAEADGPYALRKAVREVVTQGADVIKVYLDGGSRRRPTFTQEEIDAVVDEAHRAGLKVAAHCSTDAAAKMGVAAGIDSLEHGIDISDETFRAMAAKGIDYVPTLLVFEMWAADPELIGEGATPAKASLQRTLALHSASFQRALKDGVRIAFGTDTFTRTGTNAQELEESRGDGAAIRPTTSPPGTAMMSADFPGSIVPAIVSMPRVSFVMKEGKVYRSDVVATR